MNGDPDTSTLELDVRYTNNISAGVWSTRFYSYFGNWGLEQLGSVNPPILTTNDHNALNNLTTGDAHTQYARLGGRASGGQTLSGGILPSDQLILKSHGIGLNNIVVKTLNTQFNKNIDMDSNDIISTDTISFINDATFDGVTLNTNNQIFNIDGGTAFPKINIVGGGGVNFNNGFIYDCASVYAGTNITLGCDTGSVLLKTGAFPSQITRLDINDTRALSSVDLDMNSNDILNVVNINGSAYPPAPTPDPTKLNIDGSNAMTGNLDMNNNNIINCTEISANSGAGIMNINKNGPNAVELYGNGTIRRVQVSNAIYLLSGSDLYMSNSTIYGGSGSGNNLTLESTSNATKGFIVANDRLNMTDNIIINCPSVGDGSVNAQINGTNNTSLAVAGSLKLVCNAVSTTSNQDLSMSNNDITNVNNISTTTINNLTPSNFMARDGTTQPTANWNMGLYLFTRWLGGSGFQTSDNIDIAIDNVTLESSGGAGQINLDAGSIVNINTSNLDMNLNNVENVSDINSVTTGAPLIIGNATDEINLIGSTISTQGISQYKGFFPATNGVPVLSSFYRQVADRTIANTTTETTLFQDTGAIGTRTTPANSLFIGTTFRVLLSGIIDTSGNQNITLRAKLNGVTVATTGAISINADPNDFWKIEIDFTIRTVGVTGSVIGTGQFTHENSNGHLTLASPVVIDTTVANTFDITAQWNTADPTNTITTQIAHIDSA
jgi:hypothetical protein